MRLVVGVIRLVEEIADLARRGQPIPTTLAALADLSTDVKDKGYGGILKADAMSSKGERQCEIVKEGVSEYFLYTVEGRDTIPNGWSKRLPSFKTADVPIVSYYKFERERSGITGDPLLSVQE